MLLPVGPNVFDRIQFRCVAWEVFHPQALALLGDEVAGNLAAVGRQPVPDDQQRSGNVAEQGLQEVDHLRTFHAALVQPEIEVVERDPGCRREGVPIEVVLQNGSLAARRPSSHAMRPLAYSTFVDEDDRASFFLGFFFNGWPLHAPPAADGFLIPLARSSYRTLTTPAQIIQDLPNMAGVILDAELVIDQVRYSRAGPQRSLITQLLRTP